MAYEFRPPATKSECVKLVKDQTAAIIAFGYRPVEVRLTETFRALYFSGTKTPVLTSPTGIVIPVNSSRWYYDSNGLDLITFKASPPPGPDGKRSDRKTMTYSFIAPPHLSWEEAVVYSMLRTKWVSIEWAEEAAVQLLKLATAEPAVHGSALGVEPVVAVFFSCFRQAETCADAVAAVRAATMSI